MIWVGIPHEKILMSTFSFLILLRAVLFLNLEMYLRRGNLSEVLAVERHAMAWSLMFSKMKEALNLVRKLFQDPKLWGFLARVASVSVSAQNLADPLVIKVRMYAIYLSSWLYTSLFTRQYSRALLIHALAFFGSLSNADGCLSLS